MIDLGEIDRLIVIAPRSKIVSQWEDDFRKVTGRHMGTVTACDGDIDALGIVRDFVTIEVMLHGGILSLRPEDDPRLARQP